MYNVHQPSNTIMKPKYLKAECGWMFMRNYYFKNLIIQRAIVKIIKFILSIKEHVFYVSSEPRHAGSARVFTEVRDLGTRGAH